MWKPAHSLGMASPGISRPWTPPETEEDSSPRSDYFSDSFKGPLYDGKDWLQQRDEPSRCDTPTDDGARPRLPTRLTDPAPYTPTKTFTLHNRDAHGAPQYPYTPDSSRILRRSTELPSSPSPWHDASSDDEDDGEDEASVSSPVQNALLSCIAHFEDLIHTRQPDEDQMEYIVGQFEAMATYLSAPATQSRHTDEHLFEEREHGLGISKAEKPHEGIVVEGRTVQGPFVNEAYVAEVGRYIAGVQKYIEDLKLRLDEVKTLNSIQLDVIADLRRQMNAVRQGMGRGLSSTADSAEMASILDDNDDDDDAEKSAADPFGHESWETIENIGPSWDVDAPRKEKEKKATTTQQPTRRIVTIIHHPQPRSFWSSFGEALDQMVGLWHEY